MYSTASLVSLPIYSSDSIVDFVRNLVMLFDSHQCHYQEVIDWRAKAYLEGRILKREHFLCYEGQAMIVKTQWAEKKDFDRYLCENSVVLDKAKKVIVSLGGNIEEFLDPKAFEHVKILNQIVFNQYKKSRSDKI